MKTCVIFEDNRCTSALLSLAMDIYNYKVLGIYKSFEDYLLNPQDDIDLMIMDIHLEGNKKGYELVELFQRIISPKIIYTSADVDEKIIKRCQPTNPSAFLKKPIDMEQLKIVLDTIK